MRSPLAPIAFLCRVFTGRFLTICFVVYGLITLVPWLPFSHPFDSLASMRVDAGSLMAVAELFHLKKQFGPEMLYTYGPFGSLHNSGWIDFQFFWPFIILRVLLALFFMLSLIALVRKANTTHPIRLAVLAVYLFFAAFLAEFWQIFFVSFPVLVSLFYFSVEKDESSPSFLLYGLTVCSALVSLVKFSVAAAALSQFFLIGLSYLWREKKIPKLVLSYLASLFLFWILARQNPGNFPQWLWACLDLSRGYSEAMAKGFSFPYSWGEVFLFYSGIVSLLVAYFLLESPKYFRNVPDYFLFSFGIVILLALETQHAFGGNQIEQSAMGVLFILSLLFSRFLRLPGRRYPGQRKGTSPRLVFASFLIVFCIFVQVRRLHESPWLRGYIRGPNLTSLRIKSDAILHLLRGDLAAYRSGYPNLLESARVVSKLPPGLSGTADIYPNNPGVVISDPLLVYDPRPAFLSLNAHTHRLANANRKFLTTGRAPEHILFEVTDTQKGARYPNTADGASWLELFSRYQVTELTPDFVIFLRRAQAVPYRLHSLIQRDVSWGEEVRFPTAKPLWLEARIDRTVLGSLIHTLYKLPKINLVVSLASGAETSYLLLPELARAGFVLSPLVESNRDLRLLADSNFSLPGELAGQAITGIRLEVEGAHEEFFQKSVKFELSEILPASP